MKNEDPFVTIVDTLATDAANKGLLLLNVSDEYLNGRIITVNGKTLINFGSCSYLGLEQDMRLRQGVIDAVQHYGTQFSTSRFFLSAPLYQELETLFQQMYDAYPLVTATTTLGHLSTIPVILGPKDALILDLQVHHSVQMATSLCRLKGSPVEMIRHSDMNALEDTIKLFRSKGAKNIWYFADGVYSMYGDLAPVDDIITLLNKYSNFYAYIDDAHGMSWFGRHGRGTVLAQRDIHPKMIVAISLSKAFAAGGGVIIFPNQEWLRKVKTCGGPSIFSGPLQPPILGAAVASAKIHLSDDIYVLQKDLHEKILYCNQLLAEYNLPLLSKDDTTIRFIGLGSIQAVYNLSKRLMNEGFYINMASFPGVPMKRSGLRLAINRLLTKEDIKALVQAIHYHLPLMLAEENYELDFVKSFGDAMPNKVEYSNIKEKSVPIESTLKLTHTETIKNISQQEFDRLLGDRGPFCWENLLFLEKIFSSVEQPENNWQFHYFIVRDADENIILMTFFSITIGKDDVLSPASVSEKIEQERKQKNDPYYLTSKVLLMGSQLGEGKHLYLDRSKDWKGALKLMIKEVSDLQEKEKVEMILFRDFPAEDTEMHDFMLSQGYVKSSLPDSHIFENTHDDFNYTLNSFSHHNRNFIKKEILKKEHLYEIEILDNKSRTPSPDELEYFYKLYLNVKSHGFEVNVFDLPKNLFEEMLKTNVWEFLLFYLKEPESGKKILVCFVASMKTPTTYCPVLIGLDYNYVKTHGVYRQALYQLIKRGINLHASKIFLGMTASLQKRRVGAIPQEIVAYLQVTDTFKMELLGQVNVETKTLTD